VTSDEGPAAAGGGRTVAGAIALFVGAAMCWLLAFTASLTARAPLLVVGAPAQAVAGDRLPLRIIAIDEGTKTQVGGDFTVSLFDNEGHTITSTLLEELPADLTLPSQEGAMTLRIEGPTAAAAPARLHADVLLVGALPPRATFTFRPWTESLRKGEGPPLYPLDGAVLATRRSQVLVLLETGAALEEVQGNPAETMDARGRPLRLERRDIRITAPLTVAPGARFSVEVQPPDALELDLLVDGWARRAQVVRGTTVLTMPADAREDAPFVVHVSRRPFPQGKGVAHVGRVAADARGTRSWILDQTRKAGGQDDPLVAALSAGALAPEQEPAALQALSRRLMPERWRAPRIGASSERQRSTVDEARREAINRWRTPFRVLAALFTLAALIAVLRPQGPAAAAEEELGLKDRGRVRLWGALGLLVGLSLLVLLDLTLG
jgi:hypothetical protein